MAFLGVDMQWHNDGDFYGVDGKYHPPTVHYAPGKNREGQYHAYRPISLPLGPDGYYGQPSSFLGVDGARHGSGCFYGLDGQYHAPDAVYDIRRGKYSDVPD